jgi:hypothetical protein
MGCTVLFLSIPRGSSFKIFFNSPSKSIIQIN